MKWIKIIIIVWISFSSAQLFSQKHSENTKNKGEHTTKNDIAAFLGTTYIIESGFILPTLGIEYVRKINKYIGIGVLTEFELGSHIIAVDELSLEQQEISRESAILVLPSLYFNVHHLIASVGYGIELEKNENLAMLKVSLLYAFEFKNDKWLFVPSLSWDHTKRFNSLVYGFSVARRF